MAKERITSAIDRQRMNELIAMMCVEFGASKREIIDDISGLKGIPIWEESGLLSEIYMCHSSYSRMILS